MFEVIVVGTDGSESAAIAVNRATQLAKLTGATLHIVSAYRPVSIGNVAMAASAGASTPDIERVNESVSSHTHAICDHAASTARREGVAVELHAVPGEPADSLVSTAEQVHADLLVVGSRGMSGARRFVLGSVPNKVSHHAPCNLLIVDTAPSGA